MTLLDEIIEGSTDDALSTANLLRKVQIVAHRLGAEEIKGWVQRELNGYDKVAELPRYRKALGINVIGTWSGPMGARMRQPLSPGLLSEDAVELLFRANIAQSIAELEDWMSKPGDEDPSMPWDPVNVGRYNQWGEQELVPRMEFMHLLSADRVIPRSMLRGVVDSARSTALDFALSLQSADPDAGSLGGPTVGDAPVREVVWHVTNNIYGDGAQVAHGENITQRSKVVKGDLASLLKAAGEAGLNSDGSAELARVVLSEDGERPSRIKAFLQKVGEGAFLIGTGATANVVSTELSNLIADYLG